MNWTSSNRMSEVRSEEPGPVDSSERAERPFVPPIADDCPRQPSAWDGTEPRPARSNCSRFLSGTLLERPSQSFGSLHRHMPEKELNLIQSSAECMTQLRARAPQIMRRQLGKTEFPPVLFYDMPDKPF